MSAFARALELVDLLEAAGIRATNDSRNLNVPCVLIPPPRRAYDLACGYTAGWELWALVPGPGNADAFQAVDELADQVAAVLPVLRAEPRAYQPNPDAPPLVAYRLELEEGIDA